MKKSVRIIVGAVVVIILVGAAVVYAWMYKGGRNVSTEAPAYTVSAEAISTEYQSGQQKADAKYLNKTIAITGIVTAVEDSIVTLNGRVFCSFGEKTKQPEGREITVKGRCIGYDELFGEVKLDQCILNDAL
ncbi:OB-fold protein [Flavobacterium sp. RHBU_3]|uniref:OB-fold protein n=1 Tax=Flavobacterium sp. RHBU_3 TaxID=3391184 RepID=UPI0039846A67